jgi:hypothetical protein
MDGADMTEATTIPVSVKVVVAPFSHFSRLSVPDLGLDG